jgi:hypothetical protein
MPPRTAGEEAVAFVREALAIAPDRVRETANGFAWWPHALAQRIEAGRSRADGACRASAETLLLVGVTGRASELAAIAARNAREPGGSALRWDSERGALSLRAAVVARPGDDGAAARRLAHAALLQAGAALRLADELAVEIPGAMPAGEPDSPGADRASAEQAHAWRVYAREGGRAAEGLVAKVSALASLSPAPWSRASAAPHGLDAEIECAPRGVGPAGRALLRVSARQPHPRLGAGLLAVLVLPAEAEPVAERAAATAALLNDAESREWTGLDQLGGWCVHGTAGLAHAAFTPALAVEPGSLEFACAEAAARARWAVAFLAALAPLRASAAGPGAGPARPAAPGNGGGAPVG